MDVLNRLLPRHGTSNGGGFKRLKHSAQMGHEPILSDHFLAIGGPSNGFAPDDLDDQFALIPATDSPRVELALVTTGDKQEQKQLQQKKGQKEKENGQAKAGGGGIASKMPWASKEKTKKAMETGQNGTEKNAGGKKDKKRDTSTHTHPPNNAVPKNNDEKPEVEKSAGKGRTTLIGSILPGRAKKGGQKQQKQKGGGGKLNPSASEPLLNFGAKQSFSPATAFLFMEEEQNNGTANGFHQQQLEEDNFHSDWDFDEGHYYAEGDRHRLYERQKEEPKGKKPSKLPPMAGAFQKVRGKLPAKLGGTAAVNGTGSGSSGIASDFSSTSSSASSSTASSRSSIGTALGNGKLNRSKTAPNGFGVPKAGANAGNELANGKVETTTTTTLAKLRKQAKIMDIMGGSRKSAAAASEANANNSPGHAAMNSQSRKPVDSQNLLLFEETLGMD